MRTEFTPLHPAALAVAGGVAAVVLAAVGLIGMAGFGPMTGGMMGGYGLGPTGYHMAFGGGLVMLVWAFAIGALGGWIVALTYNRVAFPARHETRTGSSTLTDR